MQIEWHLPPLMNLACRGFQGLESFRFCASENRALVGQSGIVTPIGSLTPTMHFAGGPNFLGFAAMPGATPDEASLDLPSLLLPSSRLCPPPPSLQPPPSLPPPPVVPMHDTGRRRHQPPGPPLLPRSSAFWSRLSPPLSTRPLCCTPCSRQRASRACSCTFGRAWPCWRSPARCSYPRRPPAVPPQPRHPHHQQCVPLLVCLPPHCHPRRLPFGNEHTAAATLTLATTMVPGLGQMHTPPPAHAFTRSS